MAPRLTAGRPGEVRSAVEVGLARGGMIAVGIGGEVWRMTPEAAVGLASDLMWAVEMQRYRWPVAVSQRAATSRR